MLPMSLLHARPPESLNSNRQQSSGLMVTSVNACTANRRPTATAYESSAQDTPIGSRIVRPAVSDNFLITGRAHGGRRHSVDASGKRSPPGQLNGLSGLGGSAGTLTITSGLSNSPPGPVIHEGVTCERKEGLGGREYTDVLFQRLKKQRQVCCCTAHTLRLVC